MRTKADKDSNHRVGQAIRALYVAAGFNRAQFARMLDVHYTTVIKWEKGAQKPQADNIETMCALFGIRPEAILVDTPRRKRPKAFDEFAKTYQGSNLRAGEQEILASIDWRNIEPTVESYLEVLKGIRLGMPVGDAVDSEEENQGLLRAVIASGGKPSTLEETTKVRDAAYEKMARVSGKVKTKPRR